MLQRGAKTRPVRVLTGSTKTNFSGVSAWHRVFHIYDDRNPGPIAVGAQMDDGTYVEGRLYSFSAAGDEDLAHINAIIACAEAAAAENVVRAVLVEETD